MLCNANVGVKYSGKKLYEGVRFNVSVTRGCMGVQWQFSGKKHDVTLEWPRTREKDELTGVCARDEGSLWKPVLCLCRRRSFGVR